MHLHSWLFFYCHVQDSGGVICCRISGSSTKKWLGWTIRWAPKPVISRVTTPLIAVITPVKPIDFHPFIRATHVTHSMYNDRLRAHLAPFCVFISLISMPHEGLTILAGPPVKKREMTGRPSNPIHLGFPLLFFWRGKNLLLVLSIFAGSHYLNKYCVLISWGLALNPCLFGGFRVGHNESRTFLWDRKPRSVYSNCHGIHCEAVFQRNMKNSGPGNSLWPFWHD